MKGTLRLCCVDNKNTNFVSPGRDCERMPSGHPPRNTSKDETMAFSSHSARLLAHYHQNETLFLFVMRRDGEHETAVVIAGTHASSTEHLSPYRAESFPGFQGERENRWNISFTDTLMRKPLFVQQFNLFSRRGRPSFHFFVLWRTFPNYWILIMILGGSFHLLTFGDVWEWKMNELSLV